MIDIFDEAKGVLSLFLEFLKYKYEDSEAKLKTY